MTKRAKRLQRIRQNPRHVSVEALDNVLKDYGFIRRSGKGSHRVYQHPDESMPIVVVAHGAHVPTYIVKQVLVAIDRIREQQGNDD